MSTNNLLLAQTEQSLDETLIDCSIDAIIAMDMNEHIIAWNAAAEKLYDKKRCEVMYRPLLEVIPSMAADEDTLKAVKLAKKGFKSFVPALKTHKHRLHAENHFIPLKDGSNGTKGIMNIVHDVAHRIKAEEELARLNEELEKRYRKLKLTSEELASFTYVTSNKIKDPIRHLYTSVERLINVEANRLSDSGRASFRRIQSSLTKMDLLLGDILTLSQISILEIPNTTVDMQDLVNEVVKLNKIKFDERNVTITCGELGVITGSKDHIFLLLSHLINNAVKFNTSEAPVVTITCKKVVLNKEEELPYSTMQYSEYYKLSVQDNGIGFNETDKQRIFKMFEKLHESEYKGMGIGLAIVNKIIEAHNGFIQVHSTPGEGSAFHCFFPAL